MNDEKNENEIERQLEDGIKPGTEVVRLLPAAASHGEAALRDTTRALTEDQAKWGLAVMGLFHYKRTKGPGVQFTVDSEAVDVVLAAAERGFGAVVGAIGDLDEPVVKAALANLGVLIGSSAFVPEHSLETRRSTGRADADPCSGE